MQPDPWDISEVQLAHRLRSTSAQFDDPNLVTSAGPLPSLALADARWRVANVCQPAGDVWGLWQRCRTPE